MPDSPPAAGLRAVFVSYAREDTASALRIAEALRSHGVEVWFDQNELRGGDAWDQKIRKQIGDCALFLPIISQHTQDRSKGYFRLEWKLAVEQTHLMLEGVPFIAPVAIDDTPQGGAAVPAEFLKVQWTRLPGALPSPQFVEQIKRLLAPASAAERGSPRPTQGGEGGASPAKPRTSSWVGIAVAAALGVAVLAFFLTRKSEPLGSAPQPVADTKPAAASSSPSALPSAPAIQASAKSIAVLPFANMSPDKDNEFFADGVHEDVITNLAKIRDLKVISRTSVLAYRDPASRNLKKIAADLGVATVLEGSVRRAGTKVRVTAQLIDARTDEHLWAETYDRDLTDVFAIQSALAQEIAAALKANLTVGERALIAERPTQNQEAYDLFARARAVATAGGLSSVATTANTQKSIALLEEAIAKDPGFVLAYARLVQLHGRLYWFASMDPTADRQKRAKVARDAVLRLAPTRPETRMALGIYAYYCENDWTAALAEFRTAEAGMPNDSFLIYTIGLTQRRLGRLEESLAAFVRSLELSPHDLSCIEQQMQTLIYLHRFQAARDFANRYLVEFPDDPNLRRYLALARLELEHDAPGFIRQWSALGLSVVDPDGWKRPYEAALMRGDYAAAEAVLSGSKVLVISSLNNLVNEPMSLHRAIVAWLRGQRAAAATHANEALAYYNSNASTPRQTPGAMMGRAFSLALAGRSDEAAKLTRESNVLQHARDAFAASDVEFLGGQIFIALDQRDEAFATLRNLITGPCFYGPESFRLDPFWGRLKTDPRFEEILKSAKPL